MLPAGLVWGRAGAVDGTIVAPGAYGVASAAAAAQPLVYCYNPTAAAATADVQLPASLTYHHQLQQQQQMLLAAKSLQQPAAQQVYVQAGLGLQPYQLPGTASVHGPVALPSNLPYLSPDQVYLSSSPSPAGATSTNVALASGRKVLHFASLLLLCMLE